MGLYPTRFTDSFSGHPRSVDTGCGVARLRQNRDDFYDPDENRPIPTLLENHRRRFWFNAPRNNRRRGRRTAAAIAEERRAVLLDLEKEIDAIVAEMHAQMSAGEADGIGVMYARFSTNFQHSIGDQIRANFEWAVRHRIFVPRELVFYDTDQAGGSGERGAQNITGKMAMCVRCGATIPGETPSCPHCGAPQEPSP